MARKVHQRRFQQASQLQATHSDIREDIGDYGNRSIYIYTRIRDRSTMKNDINWWLSKLSKFGHVWRRFRSAVLGHWVAGAVRPWHWRRSIRICLGSKPGCGGSKMATWAQIDCQSERYRKRNGMTLTHTHTMHHNAMLIYFEEFSSDSV